MRGKIARVEILPTLNAAWKQYKLSPDTNVCILSGSETGSSGISANLMRNRKQLLSYCTAALSYIRVYPESSWRPRDIDKIADIAFNINRRTVMKRPMKMKPEQLTELDEQPDVFYIDSIKFVTLTKASMARGIISKDDVATVKDFFSVLLENCQQSCVVELNNSYFAFWHSDDKYYMFQPLNAFHKSSKCVQLTSFDSVQLYLQKFYITTEAKAEYVFHTVDFLKINDNVLSPEEILKNFHKDAAGNVTGRSGDFSYDSIGSGNVPHKMCLMPTTHDPNATSFDEITEHTYILRCPKTIDRSGKLSSTCIAAIVVLRVNRAFLWTSDTLSDILDLGSKIHKENLKLKPKGQTEIRVSDITGKIQFRSFECLVESQQIFFGKVESTVANICNIEQGLTEFFMAHIAGVIDGPNVVAVWKEKDFYYMYDAKARNGFGVKLTKEETDAGEIGMSCVTRFQHLTDLAKVYIENVPRKERQDYYKITHIVLKPFLGKNWHQWKVALPGQWCLRAEECLQSKENLRVCVTALLYAQDIDAKNWKTKTVDEIASSGYEGSDYFHGERNLKKTEMEIVLKGKQPTFITIDRKMFRYVVNALDKNIEDCLVKGFSTFFEGNKRGIFTFNTKRTWKYFSIWKSSSNWFAFGLYKHRNEATNDEKQECWCALRFTSPIDMAKSLTANIVIRKNQEFSLRSVTLNEEAPKIDKKKLKNFKDLRPSTGNAGILRLGKNFDLIGSEDDIGVTFARNTYNIAAVVAMTLMKDCWTWSNYDVWDILKISQKSFTDEVNKFENFFIKVGTTIIKLKDIQTNLWENEIEVDLGQGDNTLLSFNRIEEAAAIKSDYQIKRAIKAGMMTDSQIKVKEETTTEDQIDGAATGPIENLDNKTERACRVQPTIEDPLMEEKLVIEGFMKRFKKHRHPNAILRSEQVQLAFWKKDGAFFVFDLRDAGKAGCTNGNLDKSACPYVAWFDSMNGLLEHIYTNLSETQSSSYELITFKLKAKIVNSSHKTWYNFSLVDDTTDQWMIRSLYGNLHKQCAVTSCVIALIFASTLEPSNWNSSMLDSVLKYGRKLYRKSMKTNITDVKLTTIVTPFIIGCYEFSFTAALMKCGANEQQILESAITTLFGHSDFGVISSKGYSASIWQQNNSYFIFDPQLNGMASLTRYSNIGRICNHFLLHVRTAVTGVNVFEIFRISISSKIVKKDECPVDIAAISRLTNQVTLDDDRTLRMLNVISDHAKWLEVGKSLPAEGVLIAACAFGCYKNPEYWTSNLTEEILNLGESIYQTATKRSNLGKAPIKLDQMQGVYPFNARSAIQIRIQIFEIDDAALQDNVSDADSINPKTILTEFFQLYDNALLSSKSTAEVALTASKFGGRFYLFSCQPIDIDVDETHIGQSKGMLLPFENVYELQSFLESHFGDDKSLEDWLEIKSLEIVFVPVECVVDANQNNAILTSSLGQANILSSTLSGDLCTCSSDQQGHIEKHDCLNLAAIILSSQSDIKSWTSKTLHQIQEYGCALYRDARIEKKVQRVTIDEFPERFYIDHVEWKTKIFRKETTTFKNVDPQFVTNEIAKKLKSKTFKKGVTVYCSIGTNSFCLIIKEQDPIFYWYDPNGAVDPKKEVRASVCCFGSMDLVVGHILNICTILQSTVFTVNFIICHSI
ncbi:uncharacterized protein LOC119066555 isoform X2 [Bradysia coprophila]|uniref:uncharacterized protein LOC119066555 isoform X2 n=1 Tax=Bradysia coprophila TaxID=38358 RepID=UPI00187DC506|nr:uncharacterized protein LOC119066555 isoform X2 [Bradysia coprophila]